MKIVFTHRSESVAPLLGSDSTYQIPLSSFLLLFTEASLTSKGTDAMTKLFAS